MPIITEKVRDDPLVEFWQNVEYDSQDRLIRLFWLRCRNNTPDLTLRVAVHLGRGANTTVREALVGPGEDRTYPNPDNPAEVAEFPVNLRNVDYGISVGQV